MAFKEIRLSDLDIQRFKEKCPNGKTDDCWEWQGSVSPQGYGMLYCASQGCSYGAHRISYLLSRGAIDTSGKKVIDHKCQNPRCVNPNHLREVSLSVNMMENTHRQITGKRSSVSIDEYDVVALIFKHSKEGVFTKAFLTEWLQSDYGLTYGSARSRTNRMVERIPCEMLSKHMYRVIMRITKPGAVEIEELVPSRPSSKEKNYPDMSAAADAITYLNEKLGTRYKGKPSDISRIKARMSPPEDYTLQDFKTVIDKKIADWKGTHFEKFLRPETLFGSKFESYLNEKSDIKNGKASEMAAYDFNKYLP